jgi:hypothetical protein
LAGGGGGGGGVVLRLYIVIVVLKTRLFSVFLFFLVFVVVCWQIADLPDEPLLEAPNLRKLTPPGLDYRKRNISQLGAPYNEWYPSSRRQRRILADPIPQNNINPHLE